MSAQPTLFTHTEQQKLARSLATRIAHTEADIDDLMQEGLWSLHRMLKRIPKPTKPFAFARTVMQRSMYTYYSGKWRGTGARYDIRPTTCLEDYHHRCTTDPRSQLDDRLELEHFFQSLEAICGPLHRHIAENLISPCDPTYCRALIKSATQRSRAKRKGLVGKGVTHIRISRQQLRNTLGLTGTTWREVMMEIRTFTTHWLAIQNNEEAD